MVRTLEDKPVDATRWSTRDRARKVGMSPSSVGRIWQAFGLKPWQADAFKLSEDPQGDDDGRTRGDPTPVVALGRSGESRWPS